jgi:hypothetical protein
MIMTTGSESRSPTRIDDGGPAFPQTFHRYENGNLDTSDMLGCGGLSLRDFFAAQVIGQCLAMTTGEAARLVVKYHDSDGAKAAAVVAYRVADAMLRARKPDPIRPLRDIAAQNSADPVLANIEQGVRDGLRKGGAQ